jgi:hypothetical protein
MFVHSLINRFIVTSQGGYLSSFISANSHVYKFAQKDGLCSKRILISQQEERSKNIFTMAFKFVTIVLLACIFGANARRMSFRNCGM